MTCKDCIHCEACERMISGTSKMFKVLLSEILKMNCDIKYDSTNILSGSEICQCFQDRSRFVELSCAEWIEDEDMYGDPIYRCSNCDEHFILEEGTPTDNGYFYCPNCGAKMYEQALKEREKNG